MNIFSHATAHLLIILTGARARTPELDNHVPEPEDHAPEPDDQADCIHGVMQLKKLFSD